jgi:catechol 2,3-dioxygenase-like lactoylglutathione lyase family enzyme
MGATHEAEMTIQGLYHGACRCRDSEQPRAFDENFLGLAGVDTLEIGVTKTGHLTETLHTFFAAPDMPFEFKPQHDDDLPVALPVDGATLDAMLEKGGSLGLETRGIVDHGRFGSLYFHDPNGHAIDLACKQGRRDDAKNPAPNQVRAKLDRWTAVRRAAQAL